MRCSIGILTACLLAGCVMAEEPPSGDSCGSAAYEGLIGRTLEGVTIADNANVRIIPAGARVTMDMRPERVNIRLDVDGFVVSVTCG